MFLGQIREYLPDLMSFGSTLMACGRKYVRVGGEMRYVLLWLLGIPIPVLLLIWLFFR
jgi:hypothetical protein